MGFRAERQFVGDRWHDFIMPDASFRSISLSLIDLVHSIEGPWAEQSARTFSWIDSGCVLALVDLPGFAWRPGLGPLCSGDEVSGMRLCPSSFDRRQINCGCLPGWLRRNLVR